MDRICQKDITKEAMGKWDTLVPKIFRVAEADQNPKTIEFLGNTDNYSDGNRFTLYLPLF